MTEVNRQTAAERPYLDRLAKSVALLGMVAALSACGASKKPVQTDHKEPLGSFTNPYHGGESLTILPGLRARYDGTNLRFSTAALNRYLHDSVHHHDHEYVKIILHNGPDTSQQIWLENGQGIFTPDPGSEFQLLKCDPPTSTRECRLSVTDVTTDNYSQPGVVKKRYETFGPRYFHSKTPMLNVPSAPTGHV
jgi:hypothetical protein